MVVERSFGPEMERIRLQQLRVREREKVKKKVVGGRVVERPNIFFQEVVGAKKRRGRPSRSPWDRGGPLSFW